MIEGNATRRLARSRPLSHRTDGLDRLDHRGVDPPPPSGGDRLPACLPRTTLLCLPMCRRLVVLVPDILTGGPRYCCPLSEYLSVVCDREHTLHACPLTVSQRLDMHAGPSARSCTQRLLSGEGAASSAKDQDHQECQDQDHMCATHAQSTHAPPHDWRAVASNIQKQTTLPVLLSSKKAASQKDVIVLQSASRCRPAVPCGSRRLRHKGRP